MVIFVGWVVDSLVITFVVFVIASTLYLSFFPFPFPFIVSFEQGVSLERLLLVAVVAA